MAPRHPARRSAATGLLGEGPLLRAARRLEARAYLSATRIAVIADSFLANLHSKGVPAHKVERIFNPASTPVREKPRPDPEIDDTLILTMGNIGHTQNLVHVTGAFEASAELATLGARLVMTGDGVAKDAVRAAITRLRPPASK